MEAFDGVDDQSPKRLEVDPRVLRQSWLLVAFITLLSILSLLDRNIIALFLDEIKVDLKISDVQASLIYGGAFALTFSLMGLPMGWAVDRLSRRKVIFGGVSFWSLATVACGLATGFPSMLLARAGVGAGEAALVPAAQSIIADAFPPARRTLPFACYGMGQKAGAGIALLVGGALAAVFVPHVSYPVLPGVSMQGWQIILFLIGAPGVAIAALIFLFREPPRSGLGAAAAGPSGYRDYFRFMRTNWRYFLGHHLGFVLGQSVVAAVMGWTPTFFTRVHGWPAAQIGLWFGIVILVGPLISLPVHGWICDRFFARGVRDIHMRYQLFILPLALVPLVLTYLVPDPVLALVLLGVGMTLVSGSGAPSTASLQIAVSGDQRGKAASIGMLVVGLAPLFGASGAALINQHIFASEAAIGQSMAVYIVLALVLGAMFYELARRGFAKISIK